MRYVEHLPDPRLTSAVACLWTLEGHAREIGDAAQPILPDGCPELVIHLGDAFERQGPSGAWGRQPRTMFAGQLTERLVIRPTGRIAVLGVRFHPHGAAAFVRQPQRELVDTTADLFDVDPSLAAAVRDIPDRVRTMDEAVCLLERALLAVRVTSSKLDARVTAAVHAMTKSGGRVPIDRAARDAGVGVRQLERLFLDTVGLSPKRLARIIRFQRALRVLEEPDASPGTRAAYESGYADQPHFVRDFRELAGCAPGAHLLHRAEITGFFTSGPSARVSAE